MRVIGVCTTTFEALVDAARTEESSTMRDDKSALELTVRMNTVSISS